MLHHKYALSVFLAVPFVLLAQCSSCARADELQVVSNQQLGFSIYVLQSVKRTLEAADHDYGGHRLAAVGYINAAEKQLLLALDAGVVKLGGEKGPHIRESQVFSNLQLLESISVLSLTIDVLNGANHDYGGHRVKAVADLQAAIVELEAALLYISGKKRPVVRYEKFEEPLVIHGHIRWSDPAVVITTADWMRAIRAPKPHHRKIHIAHVDKKAEKKVRKFVVEVKKTRHAAIAHRPPPIRHSVDHRINMAAVQHHAMRGPTFRRR
jgi:hypothetical protein